MESEASYVASTCSKKVVCNFFVIQYRRTMDFLFQQHFNLYYRSYSLSSHLFDLCSFFSIIFVLVSFVVAVESSTLTSVREPIIVRSVHFGPV